MCSYHEASEPHEVHETKRAHLASTIEASSSSFGARSRLELDSDGYLTDEELSSFRFFFCCEWLLFSVLYCDCIIVIDGVL